MDQLQEINYRDPVTGEVLVGALTRGELTKARSRPFAAAGGNRWSGTRGGGGAGQAGRNGAPQGGGGRQGDRGSNGGTQGGF